MSGRSYVGKPVIVLVDASDPNNLVVSATETPSVVNGMMVSGDRLYATSAHGLAIYDIGKVIGVPLTVSVKVPKGTGVSLVPNSFDIPPTEILSSPGFDTLVWKGSLGAVNTDLRLSWKSTVSDLQPGETREVTLGTSVDFVNQGTPGTTSLPPAVVHGAEILSLSPASQTVAPAATATYDVTVTNPTSDAVTYNLSVEKVPATWVDLSPSVTVAAYGSLIVPLKITSDVSAALGEYGFAVTASAANGISQTVSGVLTLAGAPAVPVDPESHGVVLALSPAQASAGQGTPANFVVRVTNTGSAVETFSLAADLPPGVTGTFGQDTVEVPPGASNFRDVPLTLTPQRGMAPDNYSLRVRAVSTTKSSVMATADGMLAVLGNGVSVTLNPPSGAPAAASR